MFVLGTKISARRALGVIELFGIIATVILLPIDRLPYLHKIPYNLGFISLVLLLIATSWRLLEVVKANRLNRLKRYGFIAFLLALPVLAYAQSVAYAIDAGHAFEATKTLFTVSLRAFCFCVLICENPRLWKAIKTTIYITTGMAVAFALFQFTFDVFGASTKTTDLLSCCTSNSTYVFPRVHSVSIEPLYLAHFLLIPLWLLTFDFLKNKQTRASKYLVTLFILTAAVFILTVARSALASLLITAGLFYLIYRSKQASKEFYRYWLKLWAAALVIALALIASSGMASYFIKKKALHGADSGVQGSVQIFSEHAVNIVDESAQTRYSIWPRAFKYIKEEPLRGVGADNGRIRLNLPAYDQGVPIDSLQPFNNELIGLIVDLGLLGILAFLPLVSALLLSIFRLLGKYDHLFVAPLGFVLIAMLIQSNFTHTLLLTRVWFIVGLLLAVLVAPENLRTLGRPSSKDAKR